jgi:HK97 family phage major capsid protein
MNAKWDEMKAIRDKVVEEKRDFTEDEKSQVEKTLDEVRALETEVEKERKNEDLIDRINAIGDYIEKRSSADPGPGDGGKGREKRNGKSRTIGETFVNSPEWQAWLKQVAPAGLIPDSRKGLSSPPVEIKGFDLLERKDLLTGSDATSAGAFVESDRTGIYEPLGRYPLLLRSLISVRQTTSDMVEFVRQVTQVTQATPVPEAQVTDATGYPELSGEKPEGAMTFERVSEHVKTIAVWIPATKRALSDAAQLRGLIDDELREDTNEELENQLLNGNGVGENFTGLANTANTLVQAFDTDILVTTRKAITNLLINGRQIPTAYVFNPQDWETFDLLQDTEGRFRWGGPLSQGPRTLWGIPVGQSFFQGQGTGWLGNWRKMVLWDRMAATISVSDSHADFFIRNMVAILCELRAAMGVIRPSAFVEVDLEGGS